MTSFLETIGAGRTIATTLFKWLLADLFDPRGWAAIDDLDYDPLSLPIIDVATSGVYQPLARQDDDSRKTLANVSHLAQETQGP